MAIPPGRVLYLIQHHDVSGAEIMHAPVMRADPDPLLACPPGSQTEEFARRLGVPTVALPFRRLRVSGGPAETAKSFLRGLRAARELRRILRANPQRRIVYCTSTRPAMLAALAGAGLDRRILWWVADFLPGGPLRGTIRSLARRRASRVLCLSVALARDFAGRSRRLQEITTVVHPGVDMSRFEARSAAPGEPRAAILGQISPTKRTDLAIAIAERVAQEAPEFRLVVVGRAQFRDEDFALERRLRERVAADPLLSGAVEFTGHRADVGSALEGCGLLLHCRPDEPFGIALIEAMALGAPVVAPAAAGPLEIVADGVTGFLYRPGDANQAADRVLRILRDRELATRMGRAARERVRQRFGIERQLADTERLLAEIDPGGRRSRPSR